MKKIAFTYNSCTCMILVLPYFECIDFLHCMVGHGESVGSVQKKWKEGLKVLGVYLATAVARAVQEGNSQVFVTFLIKIPLYFWSKMTARTGLFQASS